MSINQLLGQFRSYRHQRLQLAGEFLLHLGITANFMTVLSLFCGLLSVYFLFQHYVLFLLFGLLHLLADALDGTIASIQEETSFGKYFDYATDNLVAILLIIKIGYVWQDYYAYLVAGLYLMAQLVYLYSQGHAPALFARSAVIVTLFLYIPAITITSSLPVLAYLFAGIISVYSLARQLQWFVASTKKE